ncbi:DUF3368 domain-containing protein [Halobellus limi]|jgi:predicted nucleic acid-binding protein|uniref:DUF3368 domain-containing protein n=1 Tax=Halobellus limi TaxID=699433 RepID=A0A1H5UX38_9EURY|nr:DUF3368 domain-containing protein [Halobellus limi]QCC46913.1 DUF3368 domain-containing protein [Halobellus limi]SEF78777.1 Predicted nucleic acid-binding protein, contains PIN domain [Halobellus limi]
MWVFDATPLIYLGKTDSLDLLRNLDEPCVIPERVYAEVVEAGVEQGHPDARRVERAVSDGVFRVVAVEESGMLTRLRENPNLSEADAAVLACADARDGTAVMDEAYGRDVAGVENITTRGTAYLLLLLVSRDRITVETARTVVDAMVEAGWYCAPDVYAKILRKLESFEE